MTDSAAHENSDRDLTDPGASDTAESGGQGADDRYVEGNLGGGAIGATLDEEDEPAEQGTTEQGTAEDRERAADERDDEAAPPAQEPSA